MEQIDNPLTLWWMMLTREQRIGIISTSEKRLGAVR